MTVALWVHSTRQTAQGPFPALHLEETLQVTGAQRILFGDLSLDLIGLISICTNVPANIGLPSLRCRRPGFMARGIFQIQLNKESKSTASRFGTQTEQIFSTYMAHVWNGMSGP